MQLCFFRERSTLNHSSSNFSVSSFRFTGNVYHDKHHSCIMGLDVRRFDVIIDAPVYVMETDWAVVATLEGEYDSPS